MEMEGGNYKVIVAVEKVASASGYCIGDDDGRKLGGIGSKGGYYSRRNLKAKDNK